MSLRSGVVLRVFREVTTPIGEDTTVVEAQIDGEPDPIQALVIGTEPPPPFGLAVFDDSFYPSWVCMGARGGVEPVVREHFMGGNISAVTVDNDNIQFDTHWNVQIGTGVSASQSGSHGTFGVDSQGEILLTAGGASGRFVTIRKNTGSTPLRQGQMTWIRARFSIDQTTNHIGWIGLMSGDSSQAAGLSAAGILINYPTGTTLSVLSLVGGTGAPLGFVDVFTSTSQRYVADICVSPGEFVAVWLNGNGPYVIRQTATSPVPTQTADLHLSAQSYTAGGAATTTLRLDYLHLDQVGAWTFPPEFLPT